MKVGSQHLFPLTKVSAFCEGYYMDGTGQVYSTKRGPVPTLMLGSRTPSGTYLTLNKRTYQKEQLQRKAMAHKDFKVETTAPGVLQHVLPPYSAVPTLAVKREHAMSLAEGISKRGWVIAKVQVVDQEEVLIFGSKPAVHLTVDSVNDELTRLATLNQGVKYVKLKIDGGRVLGGMQAL